MLIALWLKIISISLKLYGHVSVLQCPPSIFRLKLFVRNLSLRGFESIVYMWLQTVSFDFRSNNWQVQTTCFLVFRLNLFILFRHFYFRFAIVKMTCYYSFRSLIKLYTITCGRPIYTMLHWWINENEIFEKSIAVLLRVMLMRKSDHQKKQVLRNILSRPSSV